MPSFSSSSQTTISVTVVEPSTDAHPRHRRQYQHSRTCSKHSSPRPSNQRKTSRMQDYSPQVLAQKFNNKGALHLEQGNYDRAIPYLVKALQLVEQTTASQEEADLDWSNASISSSSSSSSRSSSRPCNDCPHCSHCSLEACMMESRKHHLHHHHQQQQQQRIVDPLLPSPPPSHVAWSSPSISSPTRLLDKRPLAGTAATPHPHPFAMSTIASSSSSTRGDSPEQQQQQGYLYCQPLFVHSTCIIHEHDMDTTLSLMVVFNLALAYQLTGHWIKARRLYELCYQLQLQQHHQQDPRGSSSSSSSSSSSPLWFTMCLANNLSELHRALGDSNKYNICLQHLLSTMMYMVDCQLAQSHATATTTTTTTTTTNATRIPATTNSMTTTTQQQADYNEYMMKTVMDGFFRNASKMILGKETASAA